MHGQAIRKIRLLCHTFDSDFPEDQAARAPTPSGKPKGHQFTLSAPVQFHSTSAQPLFRAARPQVIVTRPFSNRGIHASRYPLWGSRRLHFHTAD